MMNSTSRTAFLLAPAAAVLLFACGGEEPASGSSGASKARAEAPEKVAQATGASHDLAPGESAHDGDHGHDHAAGDSDGHDHDADAGPAGGAVAHDHDGDGFADHPVDGSEAHGAPGALTSGTPNPGAVAESERSSHARPGKPRLDVENPEHDFGTAIEGERLSHTFKLTSSGDTDLIINSAKPTCGCTIAKLAVVKEDGESEVYKMGDNIPPGTELELQARLDTKNKHNVASSKINIFCNDPRSTVTLGLKTQVDQYFQISPGSLAFGELSVADVVEKSFTVRGKKPGPFMLSLDGRTTPPGVKIDLVPENPTEDGKAEAWTVVVTLGPDGREGNLGYPVQLRSDEEVVGATKLKGGETPTYGASVMVTARIRGLISWEPQYLSYGLVRPGQVVSRSLNVSSFDEDFVFDVEKVSVELTGPNEQQPDFAWASSFSHVITPSEDGKSFGVELTLDGLPDDADGSFQGRVLIKTGHEQKPEIPVLFSGVCRPGLVRRN